MDARLVPSPVSPDGDGLLPLLDVVVSVCSTHSSRHGLTAAVYAQACA
jgi:hypothetical protein